MTQALARAPAAVVEIALGDHAKSADRGEQPAFAAVDLVHAVALSHRLAVTTAWQFEVPSEHLARVAIGPGIAFTAPAAATAAAVSEVVTVAVT